MACKPAGEKDEEIWDAYMIGKCVLDLSNTSAQGTVHPILFAPLELIVNSIDEIIFRSKTAVYIQTP